MTPQNHRGSHHGRAAPRRPGQQLHRRNLWLDTDTWAQATAHADRLGVTVAVLVRAAIRHGLPAAVADYEPHPPTETTEVTP